MIRSGVRSRFRLNSSLGSISPALACKGIPSQAPNEKFGEIYKIEPRMQDLLRLYVDRRAAPLRLGLKLQAQERGYSAGSRGKINQLRPAHFCISGVLAPAFPQLVFPMTPLTYL